jgi:hypothetical protein
MVKKKRYNRIRRELNMLIKNINKNYKIISINHANDKYMLSSVYNCMMVNL